MTVVAEKVPPERTLLTVLDEAGRDSARRAATAMGPVVSGETPRKSGATAQALKPRVTRTGTGYAVTVAPPRGRRHPSSRYGATIADVMRWVQRGTGIHRTGGGPKAPIRGGAHGKGATFLQRAPLSVYGKLYASVEGQDPNPFMRRIRAAGTLRVEPILTAGAQEAARALERAID